MPFIHCRDCDYWRRRENGELVPAKQGADDAFCYRRSWDVAQDVEDDEGPLDGDGCGDGERRKGKGRVKR